MGWTPLSLANKFLNVLYIHNLKHDVLASNIFPAHAYNYVVVLTKLPVANTLAGGVMTGADVTGTTGAGVTGAGDVKTGVGVIGAGVTGAGDVKTGAGVTGAGVVTTGVIDAGVTGAGAMVFDGIIPGWILLTNLSNGSDDIDTPRGDDNAAAIPEEIAV